ncbi:MAG: hypothetical protein ACKVZH_19525 [Blastocatellia bacterium]
MADYKPGDLLVGIVDFFAIVLPGAMLTFVGLKFEKHIFNGSILPVLGEGPPRWIAFILAAYLVGNIVFLLGASILDQLYGVTYRQYKSRRTEDALFLVAKNLKDEAQKSLREKKDFKSEKDLENPFKWSRAMVRIKNTSAVAEIDRLEASSKFFRSLVVVLFVSLFVLATKNSLYPLGLCLFVMVFWGLRYSAVDLKKLEEKGDLPQSRTLRRLLELIEKTQRHGWLTASLFWLTTITLTVLTAWKRAEWIWPSSCLLMLALSFWCYASQRWKMTQTAYLYFVMLSTLPNEKEKPTAES